MRIGFMEPQYIATSYFAIIITLSAFICLKHFLYLWWHNQEYFAFFYLFYERNIRLYFNLCFCINKPRYAFIQVMITKFYYGTLSHKKLPNLFLYTPFLCWSILLLGRNFSTEPRSDHRIPVPRWAIVQWTYVTFLRSTSLIGPGLYYACIQKSNMCIFIAHPSQSRMQIVNSAL